MRGAKVAMETTLPLMQTALAWIRATHLWSGWRIAHAITLF